MARPIVLANGSMHIGINNRGEVHDLYFPYVGMENHTIGKGLQHRIGVWVDDTFSWLESDDWAVSFTYPHTALIGHTVARNDNLGVTLEFDDTVDSDQNAFMRSIHVVNHRPDKRQIRLFMHQAFAIGDSRSNTDTVQYLPENDAIMHYRGRRIFIISGRANSQPFDQFAMGLFGIDGREGTWRDAEDGELNSCMVEHGRVDSTLRFKLDIEPHESTRVEYWIAAGTTMRDALTVHKSLASGGMSQQFESTAAWWHKWLEPVLVVSKNLDYATKQQFIQSAMILRSHVDKRGAVIASTDSTMLNYARDAYAYSWPRDGALVLWPLIRLGYQAEPRAFFDFCRRGLHPSGYLAHKYRADGSLGSSWHPYVHANGDVAAPIQEDETALVVFMFAQFYHQNESDELLDEYYQSFIKPMAEWMAGHIDATTNLPKPTYDLWEEHYMVTSFTTAITHSALLAAADLAETVKDSDSAVNWRSVADDIQHAAGKHLYSQDRQSIIKGLRPLEDGGYEQDQTLDMSGVFGSFMYGLFAPDSREITDSIATLRQRFSQAENIGLPRYENDSYHRESNELASNYWHITSLWHAQYCLEVGDVDTARTIIDWVRERSLPTGVLSEQIVPSDQRITSVAPLAWSHAEYLGTILDLLSEERT